MEVDLLNWENEIIDRVSLEPNIFCVKENKDVIHSVVNWQLAKRRRGTHKTKTIGEISGTTAKPYKQKRTGRARQGSLRSPQFVSGAVIFGPRPRDYSYKLNKKVKALGLKMALSLKVRTMALKIIANDSGGGILSWNKTTDFSKVISKFSSKKILLLTSEKEEALLKVSRNIWNVSVLPICGLNVYDLLRHDLVLVMSDSLELIVRRLN